MYCNTGVTIEYVLQYIWVRSRRCACLITWFCYQMIAKPGNKTGTPSWPDPYDICYLQGSHAFRMMKFLDFSRTFPGPNLIFQGPSRTKTTINTHKYSLPSNRFSLLLHKQGKQRFNGTYQEILMNNISEICVMWVPGCPLDLHTNSPSHFQLCYIVTWSKILSGMILCIISARFLWWHFFNIH